MTNRIFLFLILSNIGSALFAAPSSADHSAQSVLHILDYIRVDYANTVVNGHVVDEEEYHEQHKLAALLRKLNTNLPMTKHSSRITGSIDYANPDH